MKFTKFKSFLINKNDDLLGIKTPETPIPFYIDLDRIEFFYPNLDDNAQMEGIIVYFHSGNDCYLNIDIHEFLDILEKNSSK